MVSVLKDMDWKTLVFLGAIFILVQAFTKTGRVSFMRFVRYGLPITLVQLGLGTLYALALTAWVG